MKPMPYIYEIEPTNHCPYRCIMCPRGKGMTKRPRGFMALDLFQRILDQFPEGQKLVRLHHFGEAVLHPEIHTLVRMTAERGLTSILSLNPATLDAPLTDKIVRARPGMVCFSLDSLTDEGLRGIRGIRKPAQACLSAVDRFIRQSRELSPGILKVLQMVNLDRNREEREALIRFAERYPEPDVTLYFADNTGFGDLSLVEETLSGGSQRVLPQARPCGAPFTEASILWNGDVVLCCYDYDGFNVIGNIGEAEMASIWNGPRAAAVRSLFERRATHALPLCGNCFTAPHNFDGQLPTLSKAWEEEAMLLDIIERAKGTETPNQT